MATDSVPTIPRDVAIAFERGDSAFLAFRRHLGLSARDCALMLGTTEDEIDAIETGESRGRSEVMEKFAERFGLRTDLLLW